MSAYTVRTIDQLEAIHHGAVKLAGAELGVSSFGLQVLDLPAGFSEYPEHDHLSDGQEEVYIPLRGCADFAIDGDRTTVESGQMVWVAPAARRMIVPGPQGVRMLVIGRAAERPYERPEGFRLRAEP